MASIKMCVREAGESEQITLVTNNNEVRRPLSPKPSSFTKSNIYFIACRSFPLFHGWHLKLWHTHTMTFTKSFKFSLDCASSARPGLSQIEKYNRTNNHKNHWSEDSDVAYRPLGRHDLHGVWDFNGGGEFCWNLVFQTSFAAEEFPSLPNAVN